MSEFTPTTKQVRKIYATWKYEDPEPDEDMLTFIGEFDRWLAEVQAAAWMSGYYTGKRDYAGSITGGIPISTPNPYQETDQ
ncbi:hypothetical protein U6G28_08870 [Actinomycetaceae bacterium MB13-C1-2]|nr:hypothetical protein U6G28_08870 [Actinomycetaceae bacterium MB13-C1-2]